MREGLPSGHRDSAPVPSRTTCAEHVRLLSQTRDLPTYDQHPLQERAWLQDRPQG
ncbi:hypothetical protein DPMN_072658 [Dreissena polymorpha]|uniref:Uncharacterized protein n=1 Tax=Dreissena polymorpha TaxID=45954 RepID=A0A9D4BXP7_DREPO|nr:hypothetical protein DPMN_072658 [Dreissena polymorpha]